jgi:hypothetical protein
LVAVVAVAASGCGSTTPDVSPSQTPAAAVVATPSQSTSPTLSPSIGPTPTPSPTPSPTPPADVAPLDGVPAPAATGQRLVIAVMVGNNIQARPQYGFNKASIVYQAPADGGEDRYMLLFQEQNAKRIEPVRSGRPYFVNWASEYRSAFAHYGGDAKTLAYLPTIHDEVLYNVDALFGSAGAFHRDTSRKAPDNAVTSSTAVRRLAVRHGAPAMMPGEVDLRPFADDLPADQRPAKGSIKIPYGRGVVSYAYDAASNAYLRSVAGKAHKDAADGKRVTARNVVVLFMRLSIDPESEPGHNRPVLDHIGSGKALVFRDGHVIPGTWSKKSAAGLTRFLDAAGKEITMVPGRIFIQVVPKGTDVTYKARAAD